MRRVPPHLIQLSAVGRADLQRLVMGAPNREAIGCFLIPFPGPGREVPCANWWTLIPADYVKNLSNAPLYRISLECM
jgi:hypothetical protein